MTDLYSTYERINSVSPRTLLKIVLYSYMNGDYSSRSMELNCKRDINFMFLLEGAPAPVLFHCLVTLKFSCSESKLCQKGSL